MSRLDRIMATDHGLCSLFEKEEINCKDCHWADHKYYCHAPRIFEMNQQELRALGDTLYV